MKNTFKWLTSNMAFIGALLVSAGFCFAGKSPAPQSIGVLLIFLHPFFNGSIHTGLRNLYLNQYALAMAIYYVLILLSGFHGGDLQQYSQLIFMQLPLIFIPFGLSGANALRPGQKDIIFATLIIAVSLTGVASFVNYVINFREIQEQITHSKPIPIVNMASFHIYYSVLLAFSAGALQWYIFFNGIQKTLYKRIAWAILIIIVILLHTISARTGLVCFYAEAAVSILWLIFKAKKIVLGLGIAIGLGIMAFATTKIIPSEKNRFENTQLDLHKYESGDNINHYSLSMRFEALKVGWAVFGKNMITGVGPANVTSAMDAQYTLENSNLITMNRIKPHNEFLYALVSMGIIGFAALCFMMFLPVFNGAVFRNYIFLMFIIVCIAAFQVEYLLERQVGITFFCLFYVIIGNSDLAVKKETMNLNPN